jgi:hypothetical protein
MPVDAYLNSEADELATHGLKSLQEKPRVPMDPTSAIQFHLTGRTITRDLKRTSREIISLPALKKFYQEKFGWSDTVFNTVDWDIFRPVYKKYLAKNGIQWMHKFCIGKLPNHEFTNEITFMTNAAPRAGTISKTIIISSAVSRGKLTEKASLNRQTSYEILSTRYCVTY